MRLPFYSWRGFRAACFLSPGCTCVYAVFTHLTLLHVGGWLVHRNNSEVFARTWKLRQRMFFTSSIKDLTPIEGKKKAIPFLSPRQVHLLFHLNPQLTVWNRGKSQNCWDSENFLLPPHGFGVWEVLLRIFKSLNLKSQFLHFWKWCGNQTLMEQMH